MSAEDMCLESCPHPSLPCSSSFTDPFPFDAAVKTHRSIQERSAPATLILLKYPGLEKKERDQWFFQQYHFLEFLMLSCLDQWRRVAITFLLHQLALCSASFALGFGVSYPSCCLHSFLSSVLMNTTQSRLSNREVIFLHLLTSPASLLISDLATSSLVV